MAQTKLLFLDTFSHEITEVSFSELFCSDLQVRGPGEVVRDIDRTQVVVSFE